MISKQTYSDLIEINPIFQRSINLAYDLGNESKVAQYIPTPDSCAVMLQYFESILDEKKKTTRASALIGPYGKGKSFLMVVLLYLLSGDKHSKTYRSLVKRIGDVCPELAEKIGLYEKCGIRLLPVIINSDYDNLSQSFSISLSEALSREGLSDLMPESAYDIAIDVVHRWMDNYDERQSFAEVCEKKLGLKLSSVCKGLKQHDAESFEQFRMLYSCITYGLEFNPLVSNDVARVIADVASALADRGWSGVFIAFDEFSKFVGSDAPTLVNGLKILQDVFELATRSGSDSQIHITCITHKTLGQYGKELGGNNRNAFRTVEGRVKEIRFTSSIGDDYQIISWALRKSNGFDRWFSENKKQLPIYSSIAESNRFNGCDLDVLFKGCFPLNPYATFSLVVLSEKYAQNERTLFTFLADNDRSSLKTFIQNCSSGLLNVDSLFDYFSGQIENGDDMKTRRIYYQARLALRHNLETEQVKLIKALATCLLVDDARDFPPQCDVLGAAVELDEETVSRAANELEKLGVLKKNEFNNSISFCSANSAEIDRRIKLALPSVRKTSVSHALNSLSMDKFFIPRRYNTTQKMTRFYKAVFITGAELARIDDLSNAFKLKGCQNADGVVLIVVQLEDDGIDIPSVLGNLSIDSRVIVLATKGKEISIVQGLIYETLALETILKDKQLGEDLQNEAELSFETNRQTLLDLVSQFYSPDECNVFVEGKAVSGQFNDILSNQFEKVYSKTPVINISLLNRNEASAQYTKARNEVIDRELHGIGMNGLSPTSPEMTIYNAIMDIKGLSGDKTGLCSPLDTINDIRDFLAESGSGRYSFRGIAEKYFKPPYGIRKGVMPVLFAKAVVALTNDSLVLYNQKREIPDSGANIAKAFDNPDLYSYRFLPGTKERYEYAAKLVNLFGGNPVLDFRDNVHDAVALMSRHCYSLAPVVRDSKPAMNIVALSDAALAYKMEMMKPDLNQFETLFENIPGIIGLADGCFDDVYNLVVAIKDELDCALDCFKKHLVGEFNTIFGAPEDASIVSTIKRRHRNKLSGTSYLKLDQESKKLENFFYDAPLSFDNGQVVEECAILITGAFVEDWNSPARHEAWLNGLENYRSATELLETVSPSIAENDKRAVDAISEYAKHDDSPLSAILKNALRHARDEFGESVSDEQFVGALASLIKEYTT